jgi:hypothetical protein
MATMFDAPLPNALGTYRGAPGEAWFGLFPSFWIFFFVTTGITFFA